ncbi:uncharacterized protein ACN63O_002614 [Diretmus argenteus]
MSSLWDDWCKDSEATAPKGPTGSSEEDRMKMKQIEPNRGMEEEEENMVTSASLEASTLLWPRDRQTDRQEDRQLENQSDGGEDRKRDEAEGERRSVRSAAESRTESERQLMEGGDKRTSRGEEEKEAGGGGDESSPLVSPAAAVLHSVLPKDSDAFWDLESVESPFLCPHGGRHPEDYNYQHDYQHDGHLGPALSKCVHVCPNRDVLKVGVSLFTSALFFPFLVWGGFVFLPFDAPLLDSAPLRLVYTLRCSVFATVPIVLGWLVLGVSRLRACQVQPLFDQSEDVQEANVQEANVQEANVHRRFVADSSSLFLIYFLQLVVMAMYLSQEQLKLVPLLTIVFALGRLAYWLAAALGSSVRGFGFGLSFLPSLVMLVANVYFIFTMESEGSIFALETPPDPPPAVRQRFWG